MVVPFIALVAVIALVAIFFISNGKKKDTGNSGGKTHPGPNTEGGPAHHFN